VVEAQIDAVLSDLRPAAVKTGMLATTGLVESVADRLGAASIPSVVVDPVMVATSGDRLLEEAAEKTIRERLLPVASLVTPNIPEARILSGLPIRTPEEMLEAAKAISEAGAGAVLVKGGHMEGDRLVDVLWDGVSDTTWTREKIQTRNTHGTGCTLSAAIAAGLGSGLGTGEAVGLGLDFVERAIRTAPGLGSGHGPLNHRVSPRAGD
jgi:hydroxymethylpyrimidine/phosphomethylpyrimidine kinase